MPAYRCRTTTHGRNMAGARGLWRATGMKNEDFGKPIIAVVNSFTQFFSHSTQQVARGYAQTPVIAPARGGLSRRSRQNVQLQCRQARG